MLGFDCFILLLGVFAVYFCCVCCNLVYWFSGGLVVSCLWTCGLWFRFTWLDCVAWWLGLFYVWFTVFALLILGFLIVQLGVSLCGFRVT